MLWSWDLLQGSRLLLGPLSPLGRLLQPQSRPGRLWSADPAKCKFTREFIGRLCVWRPVSVLSLFKMFLLRRFVMMRYWDIDPRLVKLIPYWKLQRRLINSLILTFNPFKPEIPIVIFIHYKPRIAVAILDLSWMKIIWSERKIKENYHVLVNQFHGNAHSKTASVGKLSLFSGSEMMI